MTRYIIGEKVDKAFSLDIKTPKHLAGTSEFCLDNDFYEIELTAPYINNVKENTFVVHLYASNSNSNPYLFQRDNYWVNLIPTWKFYSEDRSTIITDLPITVKYDEEKKVLVGSARFHYIDDMPSPTDKSIYIWATLDTEKIVKDEDGGFTEDEFETDPEYTDEDADDIVFAGTTKSNEVTYYNNQRYTPPSYANSRVIAVTTTTINPNRPTQISITRDSETPISEGTYWSNQIIPFIATVNSDHYAPFREEDEQVITTSSLVYNYPNVPDVVSVLSGNMYIKHDNTDSFQFASLVEKYMWFVDNKWDFVSRYLPPPNVLKTSGYIPPKNILEIMDYPTYDDLKRQYSDIPLDDYFENKCNKCETEEKPDQNILYLDEYVRLISEHKIFKYIPYALRIIDTLYLDPDEDVEYTYSEISALSATPITWEAKGGDRPIFQLLDKTNDYNYKTGGYTFGKVLCPELSGVDYVGNIDASAYIDTTKYPTCEFHIFKYWTTSDGKFLYAADDRNVVTEDDSEINQYIKNEVIHQATPDTKIDDILTKTEENEYFCTKGGYIGASCFTQDPLYNAWVCDADTGHMYKFDINNVLKYDINLNTALDEFIRNNVTDARIKSYWRTMSNTGTDMFVSPTHMVLNSKNELYVTFFDTMLLVKMSGLNGEIKNVYIFPESTAEDSNRLPLDGSWRPVGIDTNEMDEVVILFNTAFNESDPDPVYSVPSDAKLVFFDGEDFYDEVVTLSNYGGIFTEYTDRHMTTSQVMFRSTPEEDYVYVGGSIDYRSEKEYAFVLRYQRPKQKMLTDCLCCDPTEAKMEVIFKYERLKKLHQTTTRQEPPFTYDPQEDPPTDFHLDIDNLFMDLNDTLWFTLNRDYTQVHGTTEIIPERRIVLDDGTVITIPGKSERSPYVTSDLVAIRGAKERIPHTAAYIPVYGTRWITGISQSSTKDMLFIDAEHNKIVKFTPTTTPPDIIEEEEPHLSPVIKELFTKLSDDEWLYLDYHPDFDIPIENSSTDYEIGRLFARGDWTGMDWFNKYGKTMRKIITTDFGKNPVHLYAYENRYVRKHHEEWDVAEHAKIPVAHTFFPEENPQLFKAIGETLGIDEHKHYSIGKKLYEGIANQVANIHDVDECFIDSIYSLSNKEDVNIDKFILNYPEELRRMADLLSITRKKLWGDRCHCTQNYYKTKHRDEPRYCPKCKHSHPTNIGTSISPFDCGLWALTNYLIRYEHGISGTTWFDLVPVILEQIVVLNNVLDLQPKMQEDVTIQEMFECIQPVNAMLEAIEGYVHHNLERLTDSSTSYDVLRIIKFIDGFVRNLPNAYLVEDKFNRNEFLRINISKKSYNEAEEIYEQIKTNTYLNEDDVILMTQGKTNEKIILYASVLNIEEEALEICCAPTSKQPEPDKYSDPHNMFEAKSILEGQIKDFNENFDLGKDEQGNPIQIDPNVPTTSFQFSQKLDEIIETLDATINEQVRELASKKHNWFDIVTILREFHRIIYKSYLDDFVKKNPSVCIEYPRVYPVTPELKESIKCAQLLAIHTSFFTLDHWFNYCFWKLRPYQCHTLNTSVINWESKYTTMDEYNETTKKDWYKDNGTMIKLINYIIHNGTLFHKDEEYIDD